PDEIAARVVQMATQGDVVAVDGTVVPVTAGSVCLHGDSPGAVQAARAVRAALEDAGVAVTAFAPGPPAGGCGG
ncbi:LamB/YcsF family protein, partial [Pseudokineococcus sp. 1T1Z-3]|uniref:LamB/YcsF family protein n=1 Tax=Pseudokineococcus sp. 1T1Z-3 TaxID=3132745 RepID=UPI0030B6DD01